MTDGAMDVDTLTSGQMAMANIMNPLGRDMAQYNQDHMDISNPGQMAMDIITARRDGTEPERECFKLTGRFAAVLARDPTLLQSMDPFHVYLLAVARPELDLARDVLDLDILWAFGDTDKAYWRVKYNLEFKCKHRTWPVGFDTIEKPMRQWYRHLYKCITYQPQATSDRWTILFMDRFPAVPTWTSATRPHPMEHMAAHLLVHVLADWGLLQANIQWSAAVATRTKQVILMHCLRHAQGLNIFQQKLLMPMGPIERYQSTILQWLADMQFFTDSCPQQVHVDQWLQVLEVPIDWVGAALLRQGRLHLLDDAHLESVLDDFLSLNTSLPITPRPTWIDHPRVRAMFKHMVTERGATGFLQNLEGKSAIEQSHILDLLGTVPELDAFVDKMLMRAFDRFSVSK